MTANYNSVHRASSDLTESARGLMIMYRRDLYTVTILDVESSVRNWILPIIAKNIYNGNQHLIVGVYLNASRQVRTKHFPLFVRTIKKLRKENGETEITVAGDFKINPQELDSELTTYHQLACKDWESGMEVNTPGDESKMVASRRDRTSITFSVNQEKLSLLLALTKITAILTTVRY